MHEGNVPVFVVVAELLRGKGVAARYEEHDDVRHVGCRDGRETTEPQQMASVVMMVEDEVDK